MLKITLIAAAGLSAAALFVPMSGSISPTPYGAQAPNHTHIPNDMQTKKSMVATGVRSRAYLHNYNLPSSGVALEGYCPVAYFAVDKAVRGKPEFASTHNDVTYHFVSADAKKAFDVNPEKYLPAYGGWCAFGMSVSDKFPVDPTQFQIVDGRLMLFLQNKNVDARKLWNDGKKTELVRKADTHWAKVSG